MLLCLGLYPCSDIVAIHFCKINELPVCERVESCIATTAFKYWTLIVPFLVLDTIAIILNQKYGFGYTPKKNKYRAVRFLFSWIKNMG